MNGIQSTHKAGTLARWLATSRTAISTLSGDCTGGVIELEGIESELVVDRLRGERDSGGRRESTTGTTGVV